MALPGGSRGAEGAGGLIERAAYDRLARIPHAGRRADAQLTEKHRCRKRNACRAADEMHAGQLGRAHSGVGERARELAGGGAKVLADELFEIRTVDQNGGQVRQFR